LEQKYAYEKGEGAVGIIERVGKDAVNAQYSERRTQEERHPPGRTHYTTQKIKKNSPGEQRCQPADSRTIQFMVKEHSAGELDQCRLDQKGYWRMGKGKIAIGDVAERYSV